ncbi:hypothetical protein HAX54_031334, partial [Datura stramonium]|nr:hypothetical protein [Datura stramonium]
SIRGLSETTGRNEKGVARARHMDHLNENTLLDHTQKPNSLVTWVNTIGPDFSAQVIFNKVKEYGDQSFHSGGFQAAEEANLHAEENTYEATLLIHIEGLEMETSIIVNDIEDQGK